MQVCVREGIDGMLRTKLVSSANRRGLVVVEFGRSFTYIRNNSGPRIEPWGTPILTGLKLRIKIIYRYELVA